VQIVLSRTDRIGDLILSTPAIATVRASFPGAHITIVTSEYNRVVMDRSEDVDEIVEVQNRGENGAIGRRLRGADVAIALAPRAADLQVVGQTRAAVRVGYTYERRYLARLTASRYVNRLMISEADPDLCEREPNRVVRHEVDQLLDLVALAGATKRVEQLRLNVTAQDRAAMAKLLPRNPIVLHLGARWFSGGSTLESTVQLARELRQLGPLVLTYAPESDAEAPAFERAVVADAMLRGLPFYHWAAVFESACCVVTVDTGATHVASAVRRPTVVAFEHRYFRLSSQEWAPYRVPNVCVRKPGTTDAVSLARLRSEIVNGVRSLI
jgi:ADP-heptose:LPS heptosyltransferase